MHTMKRIPIHMALAVAVLFTAAACGDDNADDGGTPSENLSGEVIISGSSTVEPISSLVGELFRADNDNVTVKVDGPGTGDGFELFCDGETDISDASRPIKDEEVAACKANGVDYVELKVGIDGLTVLTSPENDDVACLDIPAIYALVGPESEDIDNWADAKDLATELGSTTAAFPDAPLDITGPGEESGTYDSFVEFVVKPYAEDRGVEEATRKSYQSSPDDNTIIQGIEGSSSSLGWVGYSFYVGDAGNLKAIEVAGEDGTCVAPSPETIADGSYPLARDLYLYVNAESAARPEVAAYVETYLGDDGYAAVAEAGYVQLNESDWAATAKAWEGR